MARGVVIKGVPYARRSNVGPHAERPPPPTPILGPWHPPRCPAAASTPSQTKQGVLAPRRQHTQLRVRAAAYTARQLELG